MKGFYSIEGGEIGVLGVVERFLGQGRECGWISISYTQKIKV